MKQAPQRQDLSELVMKAPQSAENYWYEASDVERSIGTLSLNLCRDSANVYAERLNDIEEHLGILPTIDNPNKLREQLRKSPKNSFEVNLVDYNSSFLFAANEEVLRNYTKGAKRPLVMQAYHRLGGLNQSQDLGLYMLPFIPSMVMKGYLDNSHEIGLEDQTIDLLDRMLCEFDTGRYKEHGSVFQHFKYLAWNPAHLPGIANISAATLMEVGAYFADFDELEPNLNDRIVGNWDFDEVQSLAGELSESSLRAALELLDERQRPTNLNHHLINRNVRSQMTRRYFDIAFIDLYRRLKVGVIDHENGMEEFAALQRNYIQKLEQWMRESPQEEGITFEWITALILRHHQFRTEEIASGYVRYATPREDFPEDSLPGNSTGNSQSVDVVWKRDAQKHFIQCKMKNSGRYAAPIATVVAKPLAEMDLTKHKDKVPLSMMKYFYEAVDEIKAAYKMVDSPDSPRYDEYRQDLVDTILAAAA